ncbi:MAG: mannonate dehydratase, partial [Cyclobacteriaceae bacterium]|nr:mannonate dehydratase [Cyclobacteriaceae bacterium]
VVESVNVRKAIKLGTGQRDEFIEKYRKTLMNLSQCGLKVICYNFMPLLDWVRTDLSYKTSTGALALRFDHVALAAFDLFLLKRPGTEGYYSEDLWGEAHQFWETQSTDQRLQLQQTILAGVPGTLETIPLDNFKDQLADYCALDQVQYRHNLQYFLEQVVPAAADHGVKLAIHPDDPPYSLFGMPRIMHSPDDIEFLLNCDQGEANGITFCCGSLGPQASTDLLDLIDRFGRRIYFIHLRNIIRQDHGSFYESDHLDGDLDMYAIVKALMVEMEGRHASSRDDWRIPMRPDHGHQMLDDLQKDVPFPGYSAIGRLKGLGELRGLELGIANGLTQT